MLNVNVTGEFIHIYEDNCDNWTGFKIQSMIDDDFALTKIMQTPKDFRIIRADEVLFDFKQAYDKMESEGNDDMFYYNDLHSKLNELVKEYYDPDTPIELEVLFQRDSDAVTENNISDLVSAINDLEVELKQRR